jgi:endoglucanase
MNKIFSVFFFLLCLQAGVYASEAQNLIPLTESPAPIFLGRGVNIPSIQIMNARHYKIIKEAGFNNVRIPIHPFNKTDGGAGFILKPAFFELLDTAVNRSLANDLIPIIDFHEHNAMQKDPIGTKPMFLAIWTQLAEHYKDAPGKVLFEIANEPNMKPELWNEILAEAHTVIRQSNPNRTLLIGTVYGNQIKYLKDLKIPANDKNVIVTIHYYMPIEFTHQGAEWSKNYKNISGLEWPSEKSGEQEIINDFNQAQEWSKANGIALHLGEFGTYNKSAMDSRIRWTRFVARQADKLNWAWSYWEMNQGFGIFNITTNQWNEGLYKALIPK